MVLYGQCYNISSLQHQNDWEDHQAGPGWNWISKHALSHHRPATGESSDLNSASYWSEARLLCPLIGQNVAIIVYRNARKEVSYLAHFVILDFGRKWVQKIIINPNKAFLYTINLDVTKSQNPLSLIQFMHFCCLQPFETLKQWFELNAFPGRDHGQLHQVAAGAQGLPPGLRHWPALQDRGARQKW